MQSDNTAFRKPAGSTVRRTTVGARAGITKWALSESYLDAALFRGRHLAGLVRTRAEVAAVVQAALPAARWSRAGRGATERFYSEPIPRRLSCRFDVSGLRGRKPADTTGRDRARSPCPGGNTRALLPAPRAARRQSGRRDSPGESPTRPPPGLPVGNVTGRTKGCNLSRTVSPHGPHRMTSTVVCGFGVPRPRQPTFRNR
jgi:hypothetical protein